MSEATSGTTIPDPLVALATPERVRSLLIARPPELLTAADESSLSLYLATATGIASEVRAIIGALPEPVVLDLAGWATTLGTASSIEDALYPEQGGLGETNRAQRLQTRYLGVLADLRRAAGLPLPGTGGGTTVPPGGYFSGVVTVAGR